MILLFTFSPFIHAQEYSGRVVGVSDGDTFTFLSRGKEQVKVRLSEIDTPEKNQPYGTKAKQALSDLIFGQEVKVIKTDTDRYGRLIGQVYFGDVHINRKMIREGMAWVYKPYMKDKTLLIDEKKAMDSKLGIWSLPRKDQVPPWDWRRGIKSAAEDDLVALNEEIRDFNCQNKTKCSEMVSCEEAMFYLQNCGLTRLDGDKDGVPCEILCK